MGFPRICLCLGRFTLVLSAVGMCSAFARIRASSAANSSVVISVIFFLGSHGGGTNVTGFILAIPSCLADPHTHLAKLRRHRTYTSGVLVAAPRSVGTAQKLRFGQAEETDHLEALLRKVLRSSSFSESSACIVRSAATTPPHTVRIHPASRRWPSSDPCPSP